MGRPEYYNSELDIEASFREDELPQSLRPAKPFFYLIGFRCGKFAD